MISPAAMFSDGQLEQLLFWTQHLPGLLLTQSFPKERGLCLPESTLWACSDFHQHQTPAKCSGKLLMPVRGYYGLFCNSQYIESTSILSHKNTSNGDKAKQSRSIKLPNAIDRIAYSVFVGKEHEHTQWNVHNQQFIIIIQKQQFNVCFIINGYECNQFIFFQRF